jgi:hypothetical protein
MNAIQELDKVALTRDLPEHGLERGDVGAVVLVHAKGLAYEVEFVGSDGNNLALFTLEAEQVRPLNVAHRARNASRAAFEKALAEVPDAPPLPGDEWPQ